MIVLKTVSDLRSFIARERTQGKKVALVPTMGALHEGHLTLARQALTQADIVIATIFVNPTQFAPHEDLDSYPRTWEADLEKLTTAGAHVVFYPDRQEIYPDGFSTTVTVSHVSAPLEGEFRPHFFAGVATVVTKLLLMALPDIALFGEKDWQQLQVVKRLTADLNIPVEIVDVPTVRDARGLALSSRNAYLDTRQYDIACHLNKILFTLADAVANGGDPERLSAQAAADLRATGFDKIDYLTVRDAATLGAPASGPLRVLAAAWLGKTRLIDNVPVPLK